MTTQTARIERNACQCDKGVTEVKSGGLENRSKKRIEGEDQPRKGKCRKITIYNHQREWKQAGADCVQ